ncbi:outer membrane lipoprotein carrier protein LolA [Bermanella sp. 47_1433_sub80_T6]|nr:outer membrane lipoprotein carrier protein LolA [Bermanella sp. 47_1433_sub80_T6]
MRRFLLLVVCFFTSLTTQAVESTVLLSDYLQGMNNIEAEFVQHTFDGKGSLLQTQKGMLHLKRPNKFRWQSLSPFEQLLLSNGETLWQYDEDLEQVSIQKLDQRLSVTPALLLTGNVKTIAQEYDVYGEALATEYHFVLIPKRTDTLFDRLRLEFDSNKLLSRMVIKDEVGQKTIIRLQNVKQSAQLQDSLFEFDIPPGIDVIRAQ